MYKREDKVLFGGEGVILLKALLGPLVMNRADNATRVLEDAFSFLKRNLVSGSLQVSDGAAHK